jgi:hypothetical protein
VVQDQARGRTYPQSRTRLTMAALFERPHLISPFHRRREVREGSIYESILQYTLRPTLLQHHRSMLSSSVETNPTRAGRAAQGAGVRTPTKHGPPPMSASSMEPVHSISAIAEAIGRPKSTVWCEVSRNSLPSRRYSPLHAAGAYQLRRRREARIARDRALRGSSLSTGSRKGGPPSKLQAG